MESSMNETVLSIDDGGVCVITLNRPARLNAINPALLDGLNWDRVQERWR